MFQSVQRHGVQEIVSESAHWRSVHKNVSGTLRQAAPSLRTVRQLLEQILISNASGRSWRHGCVVLAQVFTAKAEENSGVLDPRLSFFALAVDFKTSIGTRQCVQSGGKFFVKICLANSASGVLCSTTHIQKK